MPPHRDQRGTSLIEVLVTIVILAIGLLGLAGLQSRLQASEMESYQRAQALVLLNDMASRIAADRTNAPSYVTASPLGAGTPCATYTSTSPQSVIAAAQWCQALQGAAETSGGGNMGAMLGGRGCVEATGNRGEYIVSVAWQGLTPLPLVAPTPTCGQGSYDGGTVCTADRCRRVITTIVRIGNLS